MLTRAQLSRYADVLLWGIRTSRKRSYRKNDIVAVRFNTPALPLAEILHAKLLQSGLNPVMRLSPTPVMEKDFYSCADPHQLDFIPPGEDPLYRSINGSIFLHAPEAVTHLSDVDPKKIARAALARKPLRDILDRREEQGAFGWTLCIYPTAALAEQAGLTPSAYAAEIVAACRLNRRDPVSNWEALFRDIRDVKRWLNGLKISRLHIESDDIDLDITPGDRRRWIGLTGHNIPSFEIFLSPDWRGTGGRYYADQPSYRSGNLVRGVRLEFQKGRVVKASAQSGEAFLASQLATDAGACRVGEFSLTDVRFSKIRRFMANTLFDENYGGRYGNCHLALGASYSDTYAGKACELTTALKKSLGFNDSAMHWDLVNTQKRRVVAHLADGKRRTIYENGKFAC